MKNSIVGMILMAAFVVLFSAAGATFAQTNCYKTSDAEIVAAIKAQFEADAEIKDQMSHLNVSVKKRVVTLEGWLDGQILVEKAAALVKKTNCVKKTINRLKEKGGGNCGPGQRPCGDSCIDRRSTCTIGN